jgi:hypothetical protein
MGGDVRRGEGARMQGRERRGSLRVDPRECIRLKDRHPGTRWPDGGGGHEPTCPRLIACDGQHGDASAPRMPKDVPAPDAERATEGGDVVRVVVDARRERVGGRRGLAAAALVVKNDLSRGRKGGESAGQRIPWS